MRLSLGAFALCFALATAPVLAADPKSKDNATAPKSYAETIAGLSHQPGFFELYRDGKQGRVLLAIREFDLPFLLATSLPYGLGSNDVGLDRGQPGEGRLVQFRRYGKRVMLVQDNTRFQARSDNALEVASVRQAFAESALWSADIVAEQSGKEARVLVDVAPLLTTDLHGIAQRLAATKQGAYSVDAKRSAALPELARSFPDNTEMEAMLTFAGPGEGEFVRQVAVDPQSLTMRQHMSFVRLPPAGYRPRAYHPGSGAFSTGYVDFAQPLAESLDVRFQPRFRLEKTDPAAAVSAVRKPIVFYMDTGAPEPVRSALIEGANWWATAFEAAGFKDAFRVEPLPADADPMDVRYNVISWVHRATRGWSYGGPMVDPRTGEIIRGSVTLGSQRVRQDILIAEALLAPYDKPDRDQRKQAAQAMALARLRQLAAHEVGHALGFAHNFAASRNGNGSVLDYPHPLLDLDAKGEVTLSGAYGVGVGPWDHFVVAHGYGEYPPEQEQQALASLRAEAARRGLAYIGDDDARPASSAHPDAVLWDIGADTLAGYDRILRVRKRALETFSVGVLPPARQIGELEARLVPVYLLHRYQTEAVAHLVAGASYRYGVAGDAISGAVAAGTTPVPAAQQRAALTRLVQGLGAPVLSLPPTVLDLMTPPGNDYARSREYFSTRTQPVFDAYAAIEAAAAQTTTLLFDAARLNRLSWQHARDAQLPGVREVLDAAHAATWRASTSDKADALTDTIAVAAGWVVLDNVLAVLDGGALHAPVEAEVRGALGDWQRTLAQATGSGQRQTNQREAAAFLEKYLKDPASVKRRPLPTIPPGAPI